MSEWLVPNFNNWLLPIMLFSIMFFGSLLFFLICCLDSYRRPRTFWEFVKDYFSAMWELMPLAEYPIVLLSISFTTMLLASLQVTFGVVYAIFAAILYFRRIFKKG